MSIAKAALSAVLALTAFGAVSPVARAADPKEVLLTAPDQIVWTGDKVKKAILYGDPDKEGSHYVMLLRWPPNFSTRPHSHPHDRMLTVLEGTLWVNSGKTYHPEGATPMKPGSFIVDIADQAHYEVTKGDGALIEITGIGKDTLVPREEK